MSEWRELTWDDAMQRGYGALSQGEVLYEEIAEEGRSNIDIEKHLRRAELKVAQANAWLAMARELAWQRDDYGGRAETRRADLVEEWMPEGWATTDFVADDHWSRGRPPREQQRRQRHPPRYPLQDESG